MTTRQPPMTAPPPAVGIYVRKSSDRQGDLSLPAQERLCRRFLAQYLPQHRGQIRVYADVLSGRTAERPDYQQLLADARAGRLQVLVFHKTNRFGRDSAEGLHAVQLLRDLGVEVRVADLPTLDISRPEGMLIFTFLLGAGQFEVENLGAESRKGMAELIERGGWPFLAPDGYRNVRRELGGRKRACWVEVDRPRAAVVRLMFRHCARGATPLAIVRHLHALHERRVARGRSGCLRRSGRRWSSWAVLRIVTNPFYAGEVHVPSWDMARPAAHRPIVSRALFDRAQQALAAHTRGEMEHHPYLLQGLLWQGGVALYATTVQRRGRSYRYYYRPAGGPRSYYNADKIEQQVLEQVGAQITRLGSDPAAALVAAATRVQRQAAAKCARLAAQRQRVLQLGATFAFSQAEVAAEVARLDEAATAAERDRAQADLLEQLRGPLFESMMTDLTALQAGAANRQAVMRMIARADLDTEGYVVQIGWQPIWAQLWEGVE